MVNGNSSRINFQVHTQVTPTEGEDKESQTHETALEIRTCHHLHFDRCFLHVRLPRDVRARGSGRDVLSLGVRRSGPWVHRINHKPGGQCTSPKQRLERAGSDNIGLPPETK